jgi:hypothetical protein
MVVDEKVDGELPEDGIFKSFLKIPDWDGINLRRDQ